MRAKTIRASVILSSLERAKSTVTELSNNRTKLYSKTEQILCDAEGQCFELIGMIRELMKLGMVDQDSTLNSECEPVEPEVTEEVAYAGVDPVLEEPVEAPKPEVSTKTIVGGYAECLREASMQDTGSIDVNSCLSLLWKWFDMRILRTSSYKKFKKHFYYNVSQIKTYIYAIVIYYGWCIEHEKTAQCEQEFDDFFSKLGEDEKTTCYYAMPYNPSTIVKGAKEYANVMSMVLWDRLLDAGLETLIDTKKYPKSSICADKIMNMNEKMQPGILNKYDEYMRSFDMQ